MLSLRPYQRDTIRAINQQFKDGKFRTASVLATGAGKTVVFTVEADTWIAEHGGRVLVLVHTEELCQQTMDTVTEWCGRSVGLVKADSNEVDAEIVVASVQTLKNPDRMRQLRDVSLVIVDECHHATAASYMAIMEHFGCFDGRCRASGFTATLMRSDGNGLGTVWESVAIDRNIDWMVRHQYLIRPIGRQVRVPDLNLSNVRMTRGDFQAADLGNAMSESLAPEAVAKAWLEHAKGRRTIAFFPSVASAYVFRDAFREAGVTSEVVHGGLPKEDRRLILKRFRAGEIDILSNCMVLTEGFDDRQVSCVLVGRPTKSLGLYIQMAGRGLRIDPFRPWDQQDCMILDVCGVGGKGLRGFADLSTRVVKKRDGTSTIAVTDEEFFDNGDRPETYAGPVKVVEFDPLKTRKSRTWLKTKNGHVFLPGGKHAYVFIMEYPDPGTYTVAWCGKTHRDKYYTCPEGPSDVCSCEGEKCSYRNVAITKHAKLDVETALGWAEDVALSLGSSPIDIDLSNRRAPWRRRPPSEAMQNMALRVGVKLDSGGTPLKAGELSDRITTIMASSRIDPLVRSVAK